MKINPYLNFPGTTEEAFQFYRSVFGGEFSDLIRFRDNPSADGDAPVPTEDLDKIIHISLPVDSFILMGTDNLESMGQKCEQGNNQHICISLSDVEQARRLYGTLSEGGQIEMELQEMFWGSLFGNFRDRYGINWMIDCELKNHTSE